MSENATTRLRNPFTGTFITSWIVFNWKPLVYFIFSKIEISTKINFIVNNYSNIWDIIIFPLISTIVFLFLVPYVNLFNDYFIKSSKISREKTLHDDEIIKIMRETELAQKQAEKEIAVEIVREQYNKNVDVDQLRSEIQDLEERSREERKRLTDKNSEMYEQQQNLLNSLENLTQENTILKRELKKNSDSEQGVSTLTIAEIANHDSPITRDKIMKRKEGRLPKLLNFDDRLVLEAIDQMGNLTYYDQTTSKKLPVGIVLDWIDTMKFHTENTERLISIYENAIHNGVHLKPLQEATLTFL